MKLRSGLCAAPNAQRNGAKGGVKMQCSFTEEFTYDDGSKSTIVCLNQAEILYTKSPHYGLCYKCGYKKLQAENGRLKTKFAKAIRQINRLLCSLHHHHPEIYPDNCEICHGQNAGVRGNENYVEGKVVCDICSDKVLKGTE